MTALTSGFPPHLREQALAFLAASPEQVQQFSPADLQELLVRPLLQAGQELGAEVAHELRTPLAILRNNIYFLESVTQDRPTDEREALAEMRRAVAKADDILRQVAGGS